MVEPPQVDRRLEPGGCGPVSSACQRRCSAGATPGRSRVGRSGGHGEGLRRSRGEAAGEELGTHPVERSHGERGNQRRVSLPAAQPGRQREGAPSADDAALGRSPRSSPSTGELCTWRRRTAGSQPTCWNVRRSPVNTDASWPGLIEAELRVLSIQAKLHRWATDDPRRRFDDLYNLVCDPAFLTVAWDRVRGQSRGTVCRRRWSGSPLRRVRCRAVPRRAAR